MQWGRWRWFLWFLAALGSILMTGAGVAPEEAASNVAKWVEIIGLPDAAKWLAHNSGDVWVMTIGASIFSFSLAMILSSYISRYNYRILHEKRLQDKQDLRRQELEIVTRDNQNTKRDVWLLDALFYVVLRQWNRMPDFQSETAHVNLIFSACQAVRQNALDDELPIWGRRGYSGPQERLPPDYWKFYQIDALKVMSTSNPEELTVEKTTHADPNWDRYEALMTCRARVEEVWPPKDPETSSETEMP